MTLSKEDAGTYPELKTWHNFSRFFKEKFRLFEDRETAVQWLEESPFERQIYTEIEADNRNNTLYMDRGFHACNRTGIYAVVQDDRFKPMRYADLSKPKIGSWNFDGDYWRFKETANVEATIHA